MILLPQCPQLRVLLMPLHRSKGSQLRLQRYVGLGDRIQALGMLNMALGQAAVPFVEEARHL